MLALVQGLLADLVIPMSLILNSGKMMSLKNSFQSYGSVTKFFHWLIFLLLLGMVIFGYYLEDFPKDVQPVTYNIHKIVGLLILLLVALRALWRAVNVKPLPINTKTWERFAEGAIHFLLYAVIIAMPIVGWIGSSAAGRPPHIGSWQLLLPVPKSESLADISFDLHEWLAIALIVLVAIHVLAALYHHYIKRDNVLVRMLPGG
jgi:cytochrome b561